MGDRGTRWHVGVVTVAAALVASGCGGTTQENATTTAGSETSAETTSPGGSQPDSMTPDASTPDASTQSGTHPDPELFTRRRGVLHDRDGGSCDVCLWIADNGAEHERGLMGVTTMGEADGMAFLYERDTEGKFWMKDTLIDLDIVFFDADGGVVSATQMTPCATSSCRLYGADAPYRTAVEFEVGHLAELGISEIERLEISDASCDVGRSQA